MQLVLWQYTCIVKIQAQWEMYYERTWYIFMSLFLCQIAEHVSCLKRRWPKFCARCALISCPYSCVYILTFMHKLLFHLSQSRICVVLLLLRVLLGTCVLCITEIVENFSFSSYRINFHKADNTVNNTKMLYECLNSVQVLLNSTK